MPRPRFVRLSVRTCMWLVACVAVLIWGGMMGVRSFGFRRMASHATEQARAWRDIATRRPRPDRFYEECVEWNEGLAAKYGRAMWHPWERLGPDPPAPGWVEMQAQKASGRQVVPMD